MPVCVEGHIKGEDVVATVHGDDIKIGGERSAVEFVVEMISRKYEIKKQVIGRDPDFGKSGRILNRVIEWNRDGITIEADQRHVRETLKGLDLERANHTATPCAVDRKDEDGARNDDSKGERVDANDSQALTGGDITRYKALGARISYLSQDRPDLKLASITGMLCNGKTISA